jgi:hypothetical protein
MLSIREMLSLRILRIGRIWNLGISIERGLWVWMGYFSGDTKIAIELSDVGSKVVFFWLNCFHERECRLWSEDEGASADFPVYRFLCA